MQRYCGSRERWLRVGSVAPNSYLNRAVQLSRCELLADRPHSFVHGCARASTTTIVVASTLFSLFLPPAAKQIKEDGQASTTKEVQSRCSVTPHSLTFSFMLLFVGD